MQRSAGVALAAGSLLFLTAAFWPLSARVFGVPLEQQVAAIRANPQTWRLINLAFGMGSALAAAGLLLFTLHLSAVLEDRRLVAIAAVGAVGAVVGVMFWAVILYNRVATPPDQWQGGINTVHRWLFPAYSILTQMALMATGYVLVRAGYPLWLGWGMLVLAALALVGLVVLGDMPPFVYYLLMLPMGIVLFNDHRATS